MRRTASGLWRAQNMMSSAPTNGAHVMNESTGNPTVMGVAAITAEPRCSVAGSSGGLPPSPEHPLGPHEQQQDAERDAVHVVLRASGLQAAERVARAQRPGARDVEHAIDEVAVDPADHPGERQQ